MPFTMMGLDVLSFMKRYRVQIAYRSKTATEPSPLSQCVAGVAAQTKEYPTGVRFATIVKNSGQNCTIFLERQNGYETGIRFLPWEPDYCVYTQVDAAAALIFTGPLSGCNIYVAGTRAAPILFHTNSNSNAGDAVANNTAKRTVTQNLLANNVLGVAPGILIGGRLERANYASNYLGFVFGIKDANDWKFYFNGIAADSTLLRRIF